MTPTQHECALVSLVNTNLPPDAASAVVAVYQEEVELRGSGSAQHIGKRLAQLRGGFWDVFFMGTAFSYSVACSELVELASDSWNILICKE